MVINSNKTIAVNMYKNGETIESISIFFNKASGTIRRWLRESDICIPRKEQKTPGEIYIPTKKEEENIIKLYSENTSIEEITRITGIYQSRVKTILKCAGIQLRNRSDVCKNFAIREDYFEVINTEQKAYWLGLLYADGSISDDSSITLSLMTQDLYLLEKLSSCVFLEHRPVSIYKTKGRIVHRLCIYNKKMTEDLVLLGCHPRKSFTLKFPTEQQVPTNLIHHFIRGYFDGDGSIFFTSNKNDNRFATHISIISNDNFTTALQKHFASIDIPASISLDKRHPGISSVRLSRRTMVYKLYHFLYKDATIWMNRKKEKFEKFIESRKEEFTNV